MRTFNRVVLMAAAFAMVSLTAQAQWRWTPQTGRWVNVKNMPRETAELQYEHARGLFTQGQFKQAWRETEKFDEFYNDTEYADDNQFLRGEIRLAQGKHLAAAREFQQVVGKFPSSDLFAEVIKKQYEIGDALYAEGQKRAEKWMPVFRYRTLKRASEVYAMVVQNQPFTAEAAEAQYKIGLCQMARKNYLEATFEYRRVIEEYPDSEWVDEASNDLALCYYRMSLPPEYDQGPSELAIRAVDDFKTRFPGDDRVAELDTKRAEMWESMAQQRLQTAQYYEKRRVFASARLYYGIVVNEYAGTAAAGEAQKWIDAHPQVQAPFSQGIGKERKP